MRTKKNNRRSHNVVGVIILTLSFLTIGLQTTVAQPPVPVNVPSFTPISPHSYSNRVDSVPLSEVGVVTNEDCKQEQAEWVKSDLEYHKYLNHQHNNNYFNTDPAEKYKYLQDVYFKDEGMPRNQVKGGNITRSRLEKDFKYYEERLSQTVPQCTEINSCLQAKSLRDSRLGACIWKLAVSRGGNSIQAPKKELPKILDCGTEKTEFVNKELQSIDQKIETYLHSNLGQEVGTITPSLQVVMWGTSQQANVIEKHCSGMMGFDTRVKELRAAFNSAHQACRQIQSNPSICEPVEPLKLIANYERAQRISQAASTSTPSSTNTSKVSEKKATSSLPDTHCQGGNPKGVCIAR